MKVVIADDAPEIRLLLSLVLPQYGPFEVVAQASNGQEAIEAVEAYQPDLLLVDVEMPVMDGLTAISKIREFNPQVAIVVLSGFQADAMREKALLVGASKYLEKGTTLLMDMEVLADELAHHDGA